MISQYSQKFSEAFTIVELLVVIVVIGILATITIVSYTGISQKAIQSAIISDLDNTSKQFKIFQVENMAYPDTINCAIPNSTTNKCIKPSGNNVITSYVRDNFLVPQGFCVNITNGTNSYKITSTTYLTPVTGDCSPTLTLLTPLTFSYTGSSQSNVVPADVTSAQIEVWGGKGGNATTDGTWTGTGGLGGYAKGNLSVTTGQTLNITVGNVGSGASSSSSGDVTGGNGGDSVVSRSSIDYAKGFGGGGGSSGYDYSTDGSAGSGFVHASLTNTLVQSGISSGDVSNRGLAKISYMSLKMNY